jgi:hypothetical protein
MHKQFEHNYGIVKVRVAATASHLNIIDLPGDIWFLWADKNRAHGLKFNSRPPDPIGKHFGLITFQNTKQQKYVPGGKPVKIIPVLDKIGVI